MPGITGRAYTPNSTCLKQPAPKARPVVPLETHPRPSSSSANVPVSVRPSRKAYSTLLSASTQTGRVTIPQAVTLGIITEENPKPPPLQLLPTGAVPVDEATGRDEGSSPEEKRDALRAQLDTERFTLNCVTRLFIKLVIQIKRAPFPLLLRLIRRNSCCLHGLGGENAFFDLQPV